MKYIFPLSFKVNNEKWLSLAVVCVIYLFVSYAAKLILGMIPFFTLMFNIISAVIGMYCLMGIIAAILVYMKKL
ncbi:MAG: hypothetical protein ACI39F_01685 [Acutalibacteraceae bacterium]